MKVTVLVDNNTIIDRYFLGEPGISFYIEDEDSDIRLLFDAGYSDVFIQNAIKMGIDLSGLTHIVFSHGHEDHTWGLQYLVDRYGASYEEREVKPILVAHPLCLESKSICGNNIGMTVSEKQLKKYFNLVLSKTPVWLSESLLFLGEIKQTNTFEKRKPIGETILEDKAVPDFVLDDTALAFCGKDGIAILTGCSHAGICNIIEYAQTIVSKIKPEAALNISGIIGGLHLLNPDKSLLENTVDYISKSGVKQICACHCTDFLSKAALNKVTDICEIGVGSVFSYF